MKDLERRTIAEAVQGVLRHDARNKVGAIRNAAFFLRRKTEKTELWKEPRVADFFSLIDAQLKELETVLGERVGDSGLTMGPVASVTNVASCVRAALLTDSAPAGAQVELHLDEQLEADIEPQALTLALRSVLDNALDAVAPGGRIIITARLTERGPEVWVEDSGPGFSPERLIKVVAPLETTRPERAGVGLPVAWRLLRCAGGELSVKNAERGGAVVELRLRATAERP